MRSQARTPWGERGATAAHSEHRPSGERVGSVDPTALLGPCAPCLQGGRSAKGPGRKITLRVFLFLDRR